jgi:hypothetical protein
MWKMNAQFKRIGWTDYTVTLDKSAMASGLFLPLLFWTGSVIAISLMGYPGVVCMTPLAWLLALPVGLRVRRESASPGQRPILEAALSGGMLGFGQALLVPAMMLVSHTLPGFRELDPPSPYFIAVLMVIISVPVTAGLAALIARLMKQG